MPSINVKSGARYIVGIITIGNLNARVHYSYPAEQSSIKIHSNFDQDSLLT